MKKIVFCFILLCLSFPALLAQAPTWTVDENAYQYTMTFVAKLNVDGKQLIGANDKVAAFVDTTCRGISGLTYVASEATYYAYLTVFSNTQDEAVYFKLYDSATDKITVVSKQVVFGVNVHRGNLFQSYSIAEPALNDKAELLTFNFADIKSVSSIINGGKAMITLFDSYDLTSLKPVFTLSKGGKLLKNRIVQKSGEITDNFSSAISYEVLSEDESSLSSYTVVVDQTGTPTLFYKKDAVCTAGGVIKVVSNQEGASVVITANGKTVSTKTITNGEVLFSDLSTNSYIVTIGNEWKLINIVLKQK
jgi:hypothetical protein